jgi:hypothetical protein
MNEGLFQAWGESFLSGSAAKLLSRVELEAHSIKQVCSGHYARLEFTAEPSETFKVTFDKPDHVVGRYRFDFRDEAVFGMLDVLTMAESLPLRGVHIRINKMDIHPVDSKANAFRMAGRIAGRKILEAAEAQRQESSS